MRHPRPGGLGAAIFLACLAGVAAGAEASQTPCDVEGDLKSAEWRSACDAAIEQEKNPRQLAQFLFGRAYALVEQYQYEEALRDLDAALVANPDCGSCRHERGYLHGELGNYALAIADLDHEIRISPQAEGAYAERAYARTFSGDLQGAYDDQAKRVELKPDSVDALISRGEAALWLGQFDDAEADVRLAQSRARTNGNGKAQARAAQLLEDIRLLRTTSRRSKGTCEMPKEMDPSFPKALIGDCTRAFLEARSAAARAEALTTRSTAWLVLANSPDNATVDLRVAAGLEPDNHERYANLGFRYLMNGYSWAAQREFDRALALETSWPAHAGRAQARANLNDATGAEADALTSLQIEPNELAAEVLAGLAYDAGDRETARKLYLLIYRMGSREDALLERLKELGVEDPEHPPESAP